MEFSGRMNPLMLKGNYDLFQTIDTYRNPEGIIHLEFNYPEHVDGYDLDGIREHMDGPGVNGVALRFWGNESAEGEFTGTREDVSRHSAQLCKGAVDTREALGGGVMTTWPGFDGSDYPFQVDYEKDWDKIVRVFRKVADYAGGKGLKVSIEYRPCEPRVFSTIDGMRLTLQMIDEMDRPNIGATLDFCHMLMKRENPVYFLALAARKSKLYGLRMNDGYGELDNGLIFASVSMPQALEFVYYPKKYNYDEVVFFDSFPIREEVQQEVSTNIKAFKALSNTIDSYGMDRIEEVIKEQDGIKAQGSVLDMFSK